jgi:predicted transport protein
MYIAFRRNKGFVGIVVLRSKLKVYLSIDISQLQDPMKKAGDVKKNRTLLSWQYRDSFV